MKIQMVFLLSALLLIAVAFSPPSRGDTPTNQFLSITGTTATTGLSTVEATFSQPFEIKAVVVSRYASFVTALKGIVVTTGGNADAKTYSRPVQGNANNVSNIFPVFEPDPYPTPFDHGLIS